MVSTGWGMTGVAAQLPFASHPGTATVGRTQKYSNHHHSDYSYLLNVCSTPELGHTPAILWVWPFVFGMNSPEHHPGDLGRFVGARHGRHQGIPIPRPQCHNAMISMEVVGLEGLEPSTKGL
jgi:hypothetical protein